MEILLLVAIMATAASGLYIAATFNKRTEQNTADGHSHVKLQASNVLGGASMRAARLSPTPVAHVRQPTAKSPPRRIRRQCPGEVSMPSRASSREARNCDRQSWAVRNVNSTWFIVMTLAVAIAVSVCTIKP